ncbi:MAG: DUF7010 family protein [Terriglobales bacterium]
MFRTSARLKGIGIGSIFMALFGGLWMVAALNAASWVWLVACVLLPTSLLLVRAVGMLVASRQSRGLEPAPTVEESLMQRAQGRRFGWIFLTEAGAIVIVVNLLANAGRGNWILAAVGIIVGLHFLPLARLFETPLYYWTGGIQVALCLAIAGVMRSELAAADPLVGLTMGLTLWATVVILLVEGRRLMAAAMRES